MLWFGINGVMGEAAGPMKGTCPSKLMSSVTARAGFPDGPGQGSLYTRGLPAGVLLGPLATKLDM